MCFTDKRKRNWIQKEDRVPDLVCPPRLVKSSPGARAVIVNLTLDAHNKQREKFTKLF